MSLRWIFSVRHFIIAMLLLLSVSAAHFLGFLRSLPDGMQRLVATSFAAEFTGVFLYYVALSALTARLGASAIVALFKSPWYIFRRLAAYKSPRRMRRYLRVALQARAQMEWLHWPIFPVVLFVLYAEPLGMLKVSIGLLMALMLLAPIRVPHLTLAPATFFKRVRFPGKPKFSVEFRGELFLLFATALVALAYFVGQARYARLAAGRATTVSTSDFQGEGVILGRSKGATLLLERSESSGHQRYVYLDDDFIASETVPPDATDFSPIGASAAK